MAEQEKPVMQTLPLFANALQAIDSRLLNTGRKSVTDGKIESLQFTNGFASGIISAAMNAVVGANYRLQLRPDHEQLGIEAEEARTFASGVEREFTQWANSPNCWVDASRKRTFTQFLREAIRSDFLYGEVFLVRQWRPSYSGYSTCFQLVNPARISNPNGRINTQTLRNGVELNEYGEPIAYWIRTRHPVDVDSTYGTWDRIPRYNEFGVEQVIHVTDQLQADQTRGVSRFASVIDKLIELDKYEAAELDAAVLGAMYTMVIVSEYGQASSYEALGIEPLKEQLEMATAWKELNPVSFNKSRIPHLFPNEKLQVVGQSHPTNAYQDFRDGGLYHVARGVDMSFEEVSGNFSRTSYSSARASMEIADRNNLAKREGYVNKIANKILYLWGYEALLKQRLPALSVDMTQTKMFEAAFTTRWLGAPRIIIDSSKAARAQAEMLRVGTTTLSAIASQNGEDFEELIEQRAREIAYMKKLGLSTDAYSDSSSVNDDEDPENDIDEDELPSEKTSTPQGSVE